MRPVGRQADLFAGWCEEVGGAQHREGTAFAGWAVQRGVLFGVADEVDPPHARGLHRVATMSRAAREHYGQGSHIQASSEPSTVAYTSGSIGTGNQRGIRRAAGRPGLRGVVRGLVSRRARPRSPQRIDGVASRARGPVRCFRVRQGRADRAPGAPPLVCVPPQARSCPGLLGRGHCAAGVGEGSPIGGSRAISAGNRPRRGWSCRRGCCSGFPGPERRFHRRARLAVAVSSPGASPAASTSDRVERALRLSDGPFHPVSWSWPG